MSEVLSFINKNKGSAASGSKATGEIGELIARRHLENEGYRIIFSNFTCPIGRNNIGALVRGEIDIVALDGDTLCFVEVKTRQKDDIADPLASVDLHKQRIITRTARYYRRIFAVKDMKYRFDVVTIVAPESEFPRIGLLKNYWTEAKFKKRRWSDDINRPWD